MGEEKLQGESDSHGPDGSVEGSTSMVVVFRADVELRLQFFFFKPKSDHLFVSLLLFSITKIFKF